MENKFDTRRKITFLKITFLLTTGFYLKEKERVMIDTGCKTNMTSFETAVRVITS
jgi:hypothetical protein